MFKDVFHPMTRNMYQQSFVGLTCVATSFVRRVLCVLNIWDVFVSPFVIFCDPQYTVSLFHD